MASKPKKPPTFFEKVWGPIEPTAVIVLQDIILFMMVFAALIVGAVVISILKAFGIPAERVQLLEAMHWWAYFSLAVIFLIDMIFKVISHLLRGKQS